MWMVIFVREILIPLMNFMYATHGAYVTPNIGGNDCGAFPRQHEEEQPKEYCLPYIARPFRSYQGNTAVGATA